MDAVIRSKEPCQAVLESVKEGKKARGEKARGDKVRGEIARGEDLGTTNTKKT